MWRALMGTTKGVWLPLVHGENWLPVDLGFADQTQVLIKISQAADQVEATHMDRPEWREDDCGFRPICPPRSWVTRTIGPLATTRCWWLTR